MKKIFILLSLLTLFSCQDEFIKEFETQAESNQTQNTQSTPKPLTKLYKESYLNQRSGISFWWYSGWGHGTNVNESTGYFSAGHAYHDINGDGFMDILVTHYDLSNKSSVNWYLNDGTNSNFTKSLKYINGNTGGLSSHKILKTDVNNDNLADFILLGVDETQQNNYGGNFTTLVQQKNGTFEIIRVNEGVGFWFHNGSSGDLNSDGFVDVIAGDYLWWGDGTGNFINSKINITELYARDVLAYEVFDINKDGFNDLILGAAPIKNPTTIVLNNNGKFDINNTKILLPTDMTTGINDIEIYDIDSDGDFDIIENRILNNKTKLHTYINSNLKFTLVPYYIENSEDGGFLNGDVDKHGWGSFKFDDLDKDGKDEIVIENFHDGYNPTTGNLLYNCLKKVDGKWKKVMVTFGK